VVFHSLPFPESEGQSERSASGRRERSSVSRTPTDCATSSTPIAPLPNTITTTNTTQPQLSLPARCSSLQFISSIRILADHCAETDTHDHHSKSQYPPKVRAQLPHRLELPIKPPRLNPDLITLTCYTRSAYLRLPTTATSPVPYTAGASNIEPTY
jgi:hypothetical protein